MPASFSFGSFARVASVPSSLQNTCVARRRNFSAAPSVWTTQPDKDTISSIPDVTSKVSEADESVPVRKHLVKQKVSEQVRTAMRHVAHPVAIITATDVSVSPEGAPHAWRGATVSSFNTVSLSPEPIVSFNIKRVSSTFDAIRSSGLFTAHFISSQHRDSQMVATRFSRGNATSPFHDEDGKLESYVLQEPALQPRGGKPPIIGLSDPGPPLAPLNLRCEYLPEKLVHIADHVVVFGRVSGVYDRVAERRLKHGRTLILSYVNRGYMRHRGPSAGTKLWKPGSDGQKEEVPQSPSED
ncbi:hypothetical protein LTR47_006892 [Exophiala xenobiotica]|nr:hypothetical protein LTR41_009412 [Exophiala xenobiotica]KAK5232051.1 hypothetical protein LTR47_006892 [Exophiala xenobiotica]KAK5249305.1 hypothetical protein LTS06_005814 [Exophiala xenobiotica]KAK5353189.1 hypothetical protein LTR61_003146 [Exophiala xenobiotica]KAK5379970.1 hypothetical protein LTR11_003598 [Exophiala xenobiotica]